MTLIPPTGGTLVVCQNLAHLLLKERAQANCHRVDPRLFAGMQLLRVARDEPHVALQKSTGES